MIDERAEEEFEPNVEDVIKLLKLEGIFIKPGKGEEGLLIYPTTDGEIRDEIFELIENYTDELVDWLSRRSYHDS